MPFSNLDRSWSNLAEYYNSVDNNGVFTGGRQFTNVTNTQKPEFPNLRYSLFDDGFIRGGALNVGLSTLRDTTRISKFFASTKGILFLTKQVGLQLSNPLLEQTYKNVERDRKYQYRQQEGEETVIKKGITSVSRAVGNPIGPTRIYNFGINTLAQVGVNAGGIHINRFGLLPTSAYSYEKIAKENNKVSGFSEGSITKIQSSLKNLQGQSSSAFSFKDDITGYKKNNLFYKEPLSSRLDFKSIAKETQPETTTKTTNESFIPDKKGSRIPKGDEAVPQEGGSELVNPDGSPIFKNEKEALIKNKKLLTPPKQTTFVFSNNRLLQHLDSIVYGDDKANKGGDKEVILKPITLLDYFGGAGSIYGIGRTRIQTNPDQRTNVTNNNTDPKKDLMNGFTPTSYGSIDQISSTSLINRKNQKHIDPVNSISSLSGSTQNIEVKYGVSYINTININDEKQTPFNVDSINVIDIIDSKAFYSNTSNKSTKVIDYLTKEQKVNGTYGKDIINFRIEFLNNGVANLQPGINTDVLAFRAYIDDFQDGMNAKWDSYRYMGRGEEFYVYNGFTRDISVAFTVFAHSVTEMKPLYRKLNYLMSAFAPDYNEYNKMRGNIGFLTVGDYVYRQPGVFTDIKLSGMLDSHWEINIDNDQLQLPKYIKVNLSFKPIHSFLPRRVYKGTQSKTPFMTPDSNAYPEYQTLEAEDKTKLNKYLS